MNKLFILTSLILVFTSPSILLAGDNPFISKNPDKGIIKTVPHPFFMQKILVKITPLQHKLSRKLTQLTREIKERKSKKVFFVIVFISFLYGLIHAIGPGHGKTITFSYFLTGQANIKKGLLVGNLIAFLHVISALVIVLILYLIVKKMYLNVFEDLNKIIKLISYALVTLIGLFLLITTFIDLRKGENSRENAIPCSQGNIKDIIPVAFAVGLIPCPGAVIILLFSISMDVLKIGIISIFSMALGMAITISSVGILTIIAKQGILKIISKKSKVRNIFQVTTRILSSLLILFLGIFLFIGSI